MTWASHVVSLGLAFPIVLQALISQVSLRIRGNPHKALQVGVGVGSSRRGDLVQEIAYGCFGRAIGAKPGKSCYPERSVTVGRTDLLGRERPRAGWDYPQRTALSHEAARGPLRSLLLEPPARPCRGSQEPVQSPSIACSCHLDQAIN